MKLYFKYISALLKSQLQYRSSTIMVIIAQMFLPLSLFATILLLFERFGSIGEYTLYQVALCYAVTHIGFSSAELLFRGFDRFASYIRTGSFDRFMLRPRKLSFQVLASEFDLSRIGRIVQAIVVLIFVLFNIQIHWTVLKVVVLCFMILSAIMIFSAIYVLSSSICFFTVQGLRFVNIFTHGGKELSQYPLSIFKRGFRLFFTFVIPFGAFNYLPLSFLLDKTSGNPIIYALMPLLCIPFFAFSLFIWNKCSRHYKSAGG